MPYLQLVQLFCRYALINQYSQDGLVPFVPVGFGCIIAVQFFKLFIAYGMAYRSFDFTFYL
jgi:hypothetical protein